MPVNFEDREGFLIARMSGDYTEYGNYDTDFKEVYRQLEKNPCRVVVSLKKVGDVNRNTLRYMDRFSQKVSRELSQEVRFAEPNRVVRHFLDFLEEADDAHVTMYDDMQGALASFEGENRGSASTD